MYVERARALFSSTSCIIILAHYHCYRHKSYPGIKVTALNHISFEVPHFCKYFLFISFLQHICKSSSSMFSISHLLFN